MRCKARSHYSRTEKGRNMEPIKKTIGVVLLLATMLFVGCDGELTATIYVRDVIDLSEEKNEILYTNAVVAIESPGESNVEFLKQKMKEWFREAKNFRTSSKDFTNYMVADIKIPVYNLDIKNQEIEDLFSVVVVNGSNTDDVHIGLSIKKEAFQRIADYVSNQFYSTISISDWELNIVVNNDTRQIVNMTAQSVYIDNTPVFYPVEFQIDERS
ncbi:MAG: DUF7424 family protein, partial [Eubacteriales bacterium]